MCELNLWGIETNIHNPHNAVCNNVWIEPVRDWNLMKNSISLILPPCVNWTCEGLKQANGQASRFWSESVNWTCEGLKHVSWYLNQWVLKQCELNLWGIETQKQCYHQLFPIFVWIEPVRDWNRLILYFLIFNHLLVWIEPVRDWNSFPFSLSILYSYSVNWTCEGLKPPRR